MVRLVSTVSPLTAVGAVEVLSVRGDDVTDVSEAISPPFTVAVTPSAF
jgi:hypothetical protein